MKSLFRLRRFLFVASTGIFLTGCFFKPGTAPSPPLRTDTNADRRPDRGLGATFDGRNTARKDALTTVGRFRVGAQWHERNRVLTQRGVGRSARPLLRASIG